MPSEVTAAEAEWASAIRAERARQDLKQEVLAKKVGVTQGTISKAEDGRGSPETFQAIAQALGIELPEAEQ